MIPRYQVEEISKIWSDQHKFETFLKVELALLQALEGDKIPSGLVKQIKEKVIVDCARISEIEKEVHHDIIAFCSSITEQLPSSIGKFFHFGVTSSDIIDSGLTLQIKDSLEPILDSLKEVLSSLLKIANDKKDLICMGRSHGMDAEPMSFGAKWLGFYCELFRRYQDLKNFFEQELTVQFSGAVGNYTILTPATEQKAAEHLGLSVEPVSTQVIPRDRIAKLVQIGALLGSAIERIAVEIRHLHHSDIGELNEGFSKGQKGSSTMPHKKNPISGENLSGISRILKSHAQVALENNVLWHERDISHSSAERLYLPDHFGLMLYALRRLKSTLDNLVFHDEKIEGKVKSKFSYLSSYYLHQLLEKSDQSREESYKVVQTAFFKAMEQNDPAVLDKHLPADLPRPDWQTIKNIFLKNVDAIFERAPKLS